MKVYMNRMVELFPQVSEKVPVLDQPQEDEPPQDSVPLPDGLGEVQERVGISQSESGLFDKLSEGFDRSVDRVRNSEAESLPKIVEELLFTEEEKEAKAAAPATDGKIEVESKPGADAEPKEDAPPHPLEHQKPDAVKPERPGERKLKPSVRVNAEKIDALMNQVGELVVSRAFFTQLSNEMKLLHQNLKEKVGLDQNDLKPVRTLSFRLGEAIVALGRAANDLQEGVMKIRMLPISQLFDRYPRLVRDLTHQTDRQVRLEVKGENTELDKMIIEEISDPLIHIIRNAIDHGFERVEERKKVGKPETGTLTLEAYHESNHIVIEVTDDGRGIDPGRIKGKALEKGLMSKEELDRMSPKELLRIITLPGFSTADQVTQTSGRGVGMDVVKKNVERLNGTVEIDSEVGAWTQIRIRIPLTLAIIQALLVRVGKDVLTIPLSAVEETLRIIDSETSVVEGVEVIHLRDKTMPIFRLSEIFHIPTETKATGRAYVVIVSAGMQLVGLVVDELVGQHEVVIKPLVDYLQESSTFSGATIIGDGQISLILDIYELVNMTVERQARRQRKRMASTAVAAVGSSGISAPAGSQPS
jgi:two-component system chemotaxis sensor kinase CheA